MTNQPLTLVVVGALLIAGGQANAGTCPADDSISVVTAPGFSCTLGDKTFSGFSISGAPPQALVEFAIVGPNFVVSLFRHGGIFPVGTFDWRYTVTAAAPATIREGTVGIDVATLTPEVFSSSTMNGLALMPTPLINSESAAVMFTPGVSSVDVFNTSRIFTNDVLTSMTNTFDQQVESVPEPASLSLFGLGLAGLALARLARRRR